MKTSLISTIIVVTFQLFAAAEQQSSWSGDGWDRRNLRNRTKNRQYNNQAELTLAITKKNQEKKRGIQPKRDDGTTTTKPERQKKQPKEEDTFWDKATFTTPKRTKPTQPIKPPCPTKYDTSTIYVAGDTVEVTKEIYVCQDPPYEEYCNVINQDVNWTESESKLWKSAWLGIGKCEEIKALKEELVLEEEEEVLEEEKEEVSVAETEEEESLPTCPPPYDWSKTTYQSDELMEMKSNIFVCRNGYEIYCNISHWSNSLLKDENPKAKKLWHEAWEHLGPCQVVEEESEVEEEESKEEDVAVVEHHTETLEETLEEEIDDEENGL